MPSNGPVRPGPIEQSLQGHDHKAASSLTSAWHSVLWQPPPRRPQAAGAVDTGPRSSHVGEGGPAGGEAARP